MRIFSVRLSFVGGFLTLAAGAGCAPPGPSLHVLMVVGGLYHDYETLPPVLAERLTDRGEIDVQVTHDLSVLKPEVLRRYGVLLFNTCQQAELDEPTRQAIVGFVGSGKGLVAMHCSLWSFQSWPEWTQMLGGFAWGHDKYGTFPVTVLDPADATMLSVGSQFEITDEPYYVDRRDPNVKLLIRTSTTHQQLPDGKDRPGPDPQVWSKPYGKGRVFVVTFGHDAASQSDERFITLLHNGIRWAGHQLLETPHNTLTKAEKEAGFQLLFNGRDLTGWTGDRQHWIVENGELVGRSSDLKHNQFLIYPKEFGDFLLRFSVRLVSHNSGVQFRSRAYPEHVVKGYQVDVADGYYGNLHEEGGTQPFMADGWKDKGERVVILDGWNEMTVRAEGSKIVITMNGLTVVDYDEKDPNSARRGVIALQLHSGAPTEVRYRDIRIQPIDR